jgi:hypothetical protein
MKPNLEVSMAFLSMSSGERMKKTIIGSQFLLNYRFKILKLNDINGYLLTMSSQDGLG